MNAKELVIAATAAMSTIAAGAAPAHAQSPNKAEAAAQVALVVRLEAKPGKEAELAEFLRGGRRIVQDEPQTTTWYAVRLGPSTFGIFDTFPNAAGRDAHINGRIPKALLAADILARPPVIEPADVLASKIPQ